MTVWVAAVALAAQSLAFTAPPSWKPRPTASTMRVAEFAVPHAPGDANDAELVVYYFGAAGGGGVEANIDRWIGQLQQPDGSPSKAKARRDEQTVNGLRVTMVDVSGTYVAEVRPGAREHFNKPGFRLRAAVVETPRGAYYIKMTGPAKTMAAADADFKAFVSSVRLTPAHEHADQDDHHDGDDEAGPEPGFEDARDSRASREGNREQDDQSDPR